MWISALLATSLAAAPAEHLLAQGMGAQTAGQTKQAIEFYEQCVSQNEAFVRCYWEMGWSYYTLADWPQVVANWEQVERLDPEFPELSKHLTEARTILGRMTRSQQALQGAPATVQVAPRADGTLRIKAVGDIMLGTTFPQGYLPPSDGAELLTPVLPLLGEADVLFGNLEGPLCDGGTTRKCGESGNCYAFRSPTRYVNYLQSAGFDLLSTANNHAGDFGSYCRDETHTTLDNAGIAWSGPPGTFASIQRAGRRIGMIAFHTSPSGNYLNNHEAAAAFVTQVAEQHDIVIVSFHGGAEGSSATHVPDAMEMFYGEKRGHLRVFARAMVKAGADVILGHGPHVPRGLELIDGHLVAYSLGNFATYGRFALKGPLGLSLVLDLTLDAEGRLVSGAILPTKQLGRGLPQPDETAASVALIRELSLADFPTSSPEIAADGTFAPRAAP